MTQVNIPFVSFITSIGVMIFFGLSLEYWVGQPYNMNVLYDAIGVILSFIATVVIAQFVDFSNDIILMRLRR